MLYDLAIIGAGPAGLSAAIYAARGGLQTIVFGDPAKSNLAKAHVVANYFGLPENPGGADLASRGLRQALSFGAAHSSVEIVDLSQNPDGTFSLLDSRQTAHRAKTVLLATGLSIVLAGIQGEKELTGHGVSYCATCDGYFFKNKKIVVIGSSNHAAEEALQLMNYSRDISIVSHGRPFVFSPEFQAALTKNKITSMVTPRIAAFAGQEKAEKIIFSKPLPSGILELPVDGIFMATGTAGANAFAKKLGLALNGNYIKTSQEGNTNIAGLFAAGDCTGAPAQVASSVGGGCNAALSAIKLIRGLNTYLQYN